MKKVHFVLLLALFIGIIPLQALDKSVGINAGYNGGLSFQVNAEIGQFASGFPFGVMFSIAYISLNPGVALDARHIFINNNSNGDPEKFGKIWDMRLDFPYKLKKFKKSNTAIFIGPRYAKFTGRFNFIGGNEDFDVKSDVWGAGGGIKARYAISKKLDFTVLFGADYYPKSDIYSHGTTYRSDGEHVNSRKEYDYTDADAAINQPKIKYLSLIGIQFKL